MVYVNLGQIIYPTGAIFASTSLRKCLAIDIYQPTQEELTIFLKEQGIQFLFSMIMAVMQDALLEKAVVPHTTTFPHTEHAIAGIELPNILGGVLC